MFYAQRNQGLTSCDLWSASLSSAMYCRSVLGKLGGTLCLDSAAKSRLNILRPLERFSLFRDVLPERVRQIGWDVVPGFGGESIEKGPVFITDPPPRDPPDRAIGRVAEQAPQGDTVGRPALGIQHAQMKLNEAVFVAPEHRRQVPVQDKAILIA